MKIVLRVSDNGRTATVRRTTDGFFKIDDILKAWFKACKELNLPVEKAPAKRGGGRKKKQVGEEK